MEIEFLKIPKERIAVVVGRKGETKRKIEEHCQVELEINSKNGEITINNKGNDISFLKALNLIKAIGRGFSPENAFTLLDENYYLEIIDITDIVGSNSKIISQKKGRVIGKKGKIREKIEESTGTLISVYGKTIGVIGQLEGITKAKKLIIMLLEGASHERMFNSLENENEFEF